MLVDGFGPAGEGATCVSQTRKLSAYANLVCSSYFHHHRQISGLPAGGQAHNARSRSSVHLGVIIAHRDLRPNPHHYDWGVRRPRCVTVGESLASTGHIGQGGTSSLIGPGPAGVVCDTPMGRGRMTRISGCRHHDPDP